MKSRQEIKALAKDAMKQQRVTAIFTLILAWLIIMAGNVFGIIPIFGSLVVLGTLIFIDYPLMVHVEGVFIKIYNREQTSINDLFSGFSVNLLRKAGGMAWMMLWIFLWLLLLVIPGIVKMYAYSFTPLILAEFPNVTARDALKLSMRMTNGHKMKLFVLSLSFIGWFFLGFLTFGILLVVFVYPYFYTAYAGYYVELRDKALAEGVITREELYGRQQ